MFLFFVSFFFFFMLTIFLLNLYSVVSAALCSDVLAVRPVGS